MITGDLNEVLGSEIDGISKLANDTGLIDLMANHNAAPPPATYAREAKRLDYALASISVSASLVLAGYEAFNSRIPSDHRGYFFDFNTTKLFGSNTPNFTDEQRQASDSVHTPETPVTQPMRRVQENGKMSSPGNRHSFAERLDTDALNASLTAEQRIPKYDTPAWSVVLTQAQHYAYILTKQLTALKTGIDHHRMLESELQSLTVSADISHHLPQTIEDCSKSLRQAK